jgi:hypothetical protein
LIADNTCDIINDDIGKENEMTRRRYPNVDLTGGKFGRLLAVRCVGPDEGNLKGYSWECKCEYPLCRSKPNGIYNSHKLQQGLVRSCGCVDLFDIFRYPLGRYNEAVATTPKRLYYQDFVCSAKKRNLSVSVSFDEWWNVTHRRCHWCGREPRIYCLAGPGYLGDNSPLTKTFRCGGIDRIDNGKGYELSNIVPCCMPCNILRGSVSVPDLLGIVFAITRHQLRIALDNVGVDSDKDVILDEMDHFIQHRLGFDDE